MVEGPARGGAGQRQLPHQQGNPAARKGLADAGIYLYFLPPYSPELNQIEPVFRQVKYQEIPQRSHTTRVGLRDAVETGFNNFGRKLRPKSPRELRPAAYPMFGVARRNPLRRKGRIFN